MKTAVALDVGPRAKSLKLHESGFHRVASFAPPTPLSTADTAPGQALGERMRSDLRRDARERCAAALRRAAERLGLSAADIAAAIDESRQRVADMMSGVRPIAAEHAYLIGVRLPALLAAYGEELFGR